MRKVLVCGAAFAATCISAVAVSGGAEATPPTPTPATSSSTAPDPSGGSRGPSGTPSLSSTSAPGTQAPDAQAGGQDADPVVSTRGVMVTPKPPRVATYSYGPHERHRLDAYWPSADDAVIDAEGDGEGEGATAARGTTPRPAVLLFHGGGWVGGDKRTFKYFARRLTGQGFTVFSANYRLAEHAVWPAQRDDAMAALTFVKRNARKWNVDPNRIVAFGSSAGGLLADQLATYGSGVTRVRGALALSPVNIPYLAYQDSLKPDATPSQRGLRRAVVKLFGCVPVETDPSCWARAEDSDTTTHVSADDAPLLMLHYSDELVPPTHSTGVAAALRARGVPATVRILPGTQHATAMLRDETVYASIVSWLKERTR